jgi:hypothetical protein
MMRDSITLLLSLKLALRQRRLIIRKFSKYKIKQYSGRDLRAFMVPLTPPSNNVINSLNSMPLNRVEQDKINNFV